MFDYISLYYDYYYTFEHDGEIGFPKPNYNLQKFVVQILISDTVTLNSL